MHGTTMVFLFVVPIMAGFGNYFVPLMIGARDMAFPKLNALSYWLLLAGGIVFYASLFFARPSAAGRRTRRSRRTRTRPAAASTRGSSSSTSPASRSLVGAINFYATIANMRAPGMGWGRLPLFVLDDPHLRDPADPRAAGHRGRA